MTRFVARLLFVGTLTAWSGPVLAETAQAVPPEDLTAVPAQAESGDAKAQSQLGTYYSEGPPESQDFASSRRRPAAVRTAVRTAPALGAGEGSSLTLAPAEVLVADARAATSTAASRPLARAAINEP